MTVIERIEELCKILRQNYLQYCISTHQNAIETEHFGSSVEWHQKRIEELKNDDTAGYKYEYTLGKKYAKIIKITESGHKGAHAFVNLKTGDVYKAATWQSPAKGIRYNLMNDASREEMYRRADWVGGYLYLK